MIATKLIAYVPACALPLLSFVGPGIAHAACTSPTPGVTMVAPDQLLSRFPNGGGAMVSEVRNLVATNVANLDAVIGLVGRSTPEQKQAIGSGLGQAAGVCTRPDPDAARRIQEAVVRIDDREMLLAFQAVTGDRPTASTGGGGGGGGGGGQGGGGIAGGVANGGVPSSGFFTNATSVVPNTAAALSGGGGAAIALRAPTPFLSVSPGN